MAERFDFSGNRRVFDSIDQTSLPISVVPEKPIFDGIVDNVNRLIDDARIAPTVLTMPRQRVTDTIRTPFKAVRTPIAFPVDSLPLKNLNVRAGGSVLNKQFYRDDVRKVRTLTTVQPPETIQPGATVNGQPIETTIVPSAKVEGAMPTFLDIAGDIDSPLLKYGLIAVGVGLFLWSASDVKKKPRRRRSRRR